MVQAGDEQAPARQRGAWGLLDGARHGVTRVYAGFERLPHNFGQPATTAKAARSLLLF
jgi:hypothetical protein